MGAPVGLTVKMPVGAPVAVLAEAPVVADTLGVPGLGLAVLGLPVGATDGSPDGSPVGHEVGLAVGARALGDKKWLGRALGNPDRTALGDIRALGQSNRGPSQCIRATGEGRAMDCKSHNQTKLCKTQGMCQKLQEIATIQGNHTT